MSDAPNMKNPEAQPVIDDAFVEDVARAIQGCSRSVVRRLAGLPVRGRRGKAIDQELRRRGVVKFASDAE